MPKLEANLEIEHLSEAALRTVRSFYSKQASALSLVRLSTQTKTYHKQSEIIDRILLETKTNVAYVIEEPMHKKLAPYLRFYAIFLIDGYAAFR